MLLALIMLAFGTMYGIGQWYIHAQANKSLQMGTSFIPAYAESLGLNAQGTMDALIGQLGIRHFRLVSYWDQLEPSPDKYDFSLLDWQFQKIQAVHGTVSLSVGLRQPRWPECHMPSWAANEPTGVWEPQLNSFITAVVSRYEHSASLQSYQLENEFFNTFGRCTNFDRQRLANELSLVKSLDTTHPVIISRSNNYAGLPLRAPLPDTFGISVYRRTWTPWLQRYFEYPFPAWYYAFLAGAQKITTGKDSMLHELQGEAWPPHGQSITDTSLAEQNKSMDAKRLQETFDFGKTTGMREIYLWGAEYWYYRMVVLHDPGLWNVAKANFE